jgi:hypothetical protein
VLIDYDIPYDAHRAEQLYLSGSPEGLLRRE